MQARSLLGIAIASVTFPFVLANPASGQLTANPSPTAENMSSEAQGLTGRSIAAATNAPDDPYTPIPVAQTFGDGSEEGNTSLTDGVLLSEVVLSGSGARSVAKVNAHVCPDASGLVYANIKMTVGDASGADHAIEANANGHANDSAVLTRPDVQIVTGSGKEATALRKLGLALMKQAEAGWQNGLCVKIDVTEGGSQSVTPNEQVAISATAKARVGGGEIRGPITAQKTAGQKKVAPSTSSGSPAKFTYTAPDKSPDTGSVTLKSVSRRGIGIAHLEYTTALDLKIDAVLSELWHLTGTKCGGPAGTWTITGSALDPVNGNETISVTLADGTLTGPWSSTGQVSAAGASVPIHESGARSIHRRARRAVWHPRLLAWERAGDEREVLCERSPDRRMTQQAARSSGSGRACLRWRRASAIDATR